MKKYHVIREKTQNDLELKVEEHLLAGWDLVGGMSATAIPSRFANKDAEIVFCQAVTKGV